MNKIRINDMRDLVHVTISDLIPIATKVSVVPIGEDKLKVTVNGKVCNFTLSELTEHRNSAKGFINLIKERIS